MKCTIVFVKNNEAWNESPMQYTVVYTRPTKYAVVYIYVHAISRMSTEFV